MLAGTPALIRFFRLKEVFVFDSGTEFLKRADLRAARALCAADFARAVSAGDVRRGGHDGRRPVCHRRGRFRRFHRKLADAPCDIARRWHRSRHDGAARAEARRRQRGGIREDHRREHRAVCAPRRSAHRHDGVPCRAACDGHADPARSRGCSGGLHAHLLRRDALHRGL